VVTWLMLEVHLGGKEGGGCFQSTLERYVRKENGNPTGRVLFGRLYWQCGRLQKSGRRRSVRLYCSTRFSQFHCDVAVDRAVTVEEVDKQIRGENKVKSYCINF
jgi:hypothetical protein